MSEVIVITSGKGGVGKTTTSANVGTGLAILGKSVVLIDTDIGLQEPGCGDGTGKPHCLQSCRRGRRQLPYEAGPDKRQKISKPVPSAPSAQTQGQDLGESGADGETCR